MGLVALSRKVHGEAFEITERRFWGWGWPDRALGAAAFSRDVVRRG